MTVATTRPETILGDTAVCANPDDRKISTSEREKSNCSDGQQGGAFYF